MALQDVTVMQNSMKVVYKWKKSGCIEVEKHSHEGPNLGLRKQMSRGKKKTKNVLEMSGGKK